MDSGKVAELEAAQAAAQAALLAEMDLLRRQKAAAEEQARRLETQVHTQCGTRLSPLHIKPLQVIASHVSSLYQPSSLLFYCRASCPEACL